MAIVDYRYKVLLLGPGSVGKTSLLHRFVNDKFKESYATTIGLDFLSKDVEIEEGIVRLIIWDIGGQERFKFLRKNLYNGAHGALLIFDLARQDTFDALYEWHTEMQEVLKNEIPFMLVGNKLDLIKDTGRVIDQKASEDFAKERGSIYREASAKTGDNVEEAFKELCKNLIKFHKALHE